MQMSQLPTKGNTPSPVISPSLGFAFWNLNKKPITYLLRQLVDEHDIDIVILAENNIDQVVLLEELNRNQSRTYFLDDIPAKKITLLTRLPYGAVLPVSDDLDLSIRHLVPPVGNSLLLVSAHFPSKLYRDEIGHLGFASRVAALVAEAEQNVGHNRTILVGDLNMNPFEAGMIAANGLHSSMSRRIAQRNARMVDGMSFPFFYNPMWGRLGDSTQGPPGTYHYGPTSHFTFFWNMFDQVLLRPSLLHLFDDHHLKIISQIRNVSLVDNEGIPDPSIASDHLPLVFRIKSNI